MSAKPTLESPYLLPSPATCSTLTRAPMLTFCVHTYTYTLRDTMNIRSWVSYSPWRPPSCPGPCLHTCSASPRGLTLLKSVFAKHKHLCRFNTQQKLRSHHISLFALTIG